MSIKIIKINYFIHEHKLVTVNYNEKKKTNSLKRNMMNEQFSNITNFF